MAAKIYLRLTEPEPGDTNFVMTEFPLFTGSEDENLACGSCKQVIGRNVSTRTIYERFLPENRLVAVCLCGAHNLLPSQRGKS